MRHLTTERLLTKEQKLKYKQRLKEAGVSILQERIVISQQAIQQAQESANSEDKSSAGDKHETARAMSQLDRDMYAKQLEETKRDLQLMSNLKTELLFEKVGPGAFVRCKEYSFFISLGLGTVNIEGEKIIFLSSNAPIARLLDKKSAGDVFTFNKKETEIIDVF